MSDSNGPSDSDASVGAPAKTSTPRARSFDMPDGWFGLLILVLVAALCSGLVAAYWPALTGGNSDVSQERLETLETRVGQLAAGHGGDAAAAVFGDMRKQMMAAEDRIAAAEARLNALEGSGGETASPDTPDVAALRAQLGAANAGLSDITARMVKLEGAQNATTIADLATKHAAAEARVAALEASVAGIAANQSAQTSTTNARIAALEANVPADLAQRLLTLASKADTAALEQRIARLEAANSGASLQRAAQLLALAELTRAATESQPFVAEMRNFAALAPSDPAVVALNAHAGTGAPTRAMLAQRFPIVSESALSAERDASGQNFFGRLWTRIKGLVAVRRVGNVSGADSDATLARAGAKLDIGDLAGAITDVKSLKGAAAKSATSWLTDAEARLAIDAALHDANARVVAGIAPTPAPAVAPAAP